MTRSAAPRRKRQNRTASRTAPTPASPHKTGHGTNGMNSIDQLMASLSQALEQGRDVHLVGLVVAGERVHHDVNAGAERHLALNLAAGNRRIDRAVAFVERPGSGEIVGGNDNRAHAVGTAR